MWFSVCHSARLLGATLTYFPELHSHTEKAVACLTNAVTAATWVKTTMLMDIYTTGDHHECRDRWISIKSNNKYNLRKGFSGESYM